jgi:hypothetical protein
MALVDAPGGAAQEQVIVPHTTGEIVVVVRDSQTGRAIERATVVAGSWFVAVTKADGGAVLRNVPAATVSVQTEALGYLGRLDSVVVRADAVETLKVAMVLVRGAVVVGDTAWTPRRVTPANSGKLDLTVQVFDRQDSSVVGYANVVVDGRDAVLTDEGGKAIVHDLASGMHSVVIRAIGYEPQPPHSFMLRANEVRSYRHMIGRPYPAKY